MSYKRIALVGRPNVGKSTLFNRLSINKKAIVHDLPGVTRDRKYAQGRLGDIEFVIIDTPGLEESEEGKLEHRMMQQTISALEEADIACLIVDNTQGITAADKFFANLIRKHSENYMVVVNKTEKKFIHDSEYYKLGFGQPIPISAEHGQGMALLYEEFTAKVDFHEFEHITDPIKSDNIQMAIVGRPNAGKSTFINSLLGEERMLTGPEAGITRESIEIDFEHNGTKIKLIDTAGLRKRNNVTKTLEKLSTHDTITSINLANTVVLMLDSTSALEQQDLTIAKYVLNEGRALIIAVNKWDLVTNKEEYSKHFFEYIENHLPQAKGLPVVFLSALNNSNTKDVLGACLQTYELWNKKIPTHKLNQWLSFALQKHPLPLHKKLGRPIRIKYVTQIKTRPPTFKLFANDPDSITDSYIRYLTNSMREAFDLPGIPLRFYFGKSDNPYVKKNRKT